MGKTVQYETVYEAVAAHSVHPTAEQVLFWVREKLPAVGLATVYRNLEKLSSEGRLLRIPVSGGPDRFDARTCDHCHLICRSCGNMVDLPEDFSRRMQLLAAMPEVCIEDYCLIARGLCRSCQNTNQEKEK